MSLFLRLFSRKKMANEELLNEIILIGKELRVNKRILEKVNPFFEEKAGKLGPREFHPWIEKWYLSPEFLEFLEFVYSRFTLHDLSQLLKERNKKFDYYATDVMRETPIDEEKYPIEVDQYDREHKTAYFVTALIIRNLVGSALPY
ncbi:hypothetical protein JOC77_001019 [Peribacillus deserti]|uniref:Uncharacterized protein n=1 Tax=Peribacillus deserti TaxID=673318 RepID=A0ABS2QEM7_9BACI|nr:hypothetical protein [Peribacillus deserti]MBM7691612.1 hypothetical protein [Peribacillus deserti]